MKHPRPLEPASGMWQTVRSALDEWDRTARLCLIYLVMSVSAGALDWLIMH